MTDRPLYAPGCFGSALSFRNDEVCGACAFRVQCEPVHLRAKAQLQEFYGVKTATRATGELPVKVKRLFEELGKSKEEVKEAMQSGVSPYKVSEGFVGMVCFLILNAGAITRGAIEKALCQHRGYNKETSSVYARHSLQILNYCGAITQDGDVIRPVRG